MDNSYIITKTIDKTMKNYEYDDLMLQFEQMRAQGWDPQLCDTPVPYYDGRVPCGIPSGTGDIVRGSM